MNKWKKVEYGKIPSDWDYVPIDQIKAEEKYSVSMGPFGSNIKAENFIESGVPVIRGKNFNHYKYIGGEYVYLSEAKANELIGSNCKKDDLVFTHRGTIGQVGIIPSDIYPRYVISQSGMKLTVNKNVISPDFLFYFFISKYGQYQILKYESQVGVPSISNPLTSLKEIEIPLPSLPEQKAIAAVISSLDDKIDLLHRQNETLEALGQTLFREWFVEKKKDEWEEKPLGEVVNIGIGRTPPRKEFHWFSTNTNDYIWVSIRDLADIVGYVHHSAEYITEEAVEKFNIPIIPKNTVLLSFKMTVGRVAITASKMLSNEAIAHFIFKPQTPFCKEYLYYFLKTFRYELLGTTSTIVTSINSRMIKALKIPIPDDDLMKNFCEIVEINLVKIKQNQLQIQTLIKLRDTLLPKLISGEVRVNY